MANSVSRDFTPSFESLSMEDIIGAPLIATAKANSMMAQEQVKFMMNYCFYPQPVAAGETASNGGSNYHPVMIRMQLTRSVMEPAATPGDPPTVERITTSFELPLLTLVPLNSLAVDEVTIDFEMEITAMEQSQSQQESSGATGGDSPKLMGKVGAKPNANSKVVQENQRKSTSNLAINVKASPLPLPIGLTAILDLYTKSLSPIDMKQEKALPEDSEPTK